MWTWFKKKPKEAINPIERLLAKRDSFSLLDYSWQGIGVRVIINELSGFSVGSHGIIVDTPIGKLHDEDVVWVQRDGSGPNGAVFFYHHELDREPVLFPPIDLTLIDNENTS